MIGSLYIDGVDVFREYGVAIVDGGYNGLISAAELKKVDYTDWPEEDGIDPDLSNPLLDSKEFDVQFGGDSERIESFLAFLSSVPYHDFDFVDIETSRRLRLVSQPNKETIHSMESFSLRFADDFPLHNYSYLAPISPCYQQGYAIDGKLFSDYGLVVLEGSDDEITKMPSVKKNLTCNAINKKGLEYDNFQVIYQHKDVALKCVIVAPSMELFWQNYNALIFDLTRPNERAFFVEHLSDNFSCYYKSCQTTQFFTVTNNVWCEVTLTLAFTNFRPKRTWYILGTENQNILGTEDLKALMI